MRKSPRGQFILDSWGGGEEINFNVENTKIS